MPKIERSVVVPYSAEEMFALVNDIASYKEFMPLCTNSEIKSQTPDEIVATLTISAVGIEKSFTSKNVLKPFCMEIYLVDGPFDKLDGAWHFENLGEGSSRVSLNLAFKISGVILSAMFSPVFSGVASSLVDAFIERAKQIYGKKNDLDTSRLCEPGKTG